MAQLISLIKSSFPQNEHAKQAAQLSQEISTLRVALQDKTSGVFQSKLTETTTLLQSEKQKCIDDLLRMNGSYYQDPKSTLKKAWDNLVETSRAAGVHITGKDNLEEARKKLEEIPQAKAAIDIYFRIDEIRKRRETHLNSIIATEKASTDLEDQLKRTKSLLEQKHRELCGDYFADPKGKLHQAWSNDFSGEYLKLEEQRKQIEAELHEIDRQLAVPISGHRTYEFLTEMSLSERIAALTKVQEQEKDLAGVNWRTLAANVATASMLAAGYILIS